jgi:hypothetical protein
MQSALNAFATLQDQRASNLSSEIRANPRPTP